MNVQAALPLSIQPESSQVVTAALLPSAAKLYQDHGCRIKPETAISCVPKTGKEGKRGALQFLQSSPHVLGREDCRLSAQILCLQLETVTRHYFAMVIAGEGVFVTASLTLS
jgi:hypothetical protein